MTALLDALSTGRRRGARDLRREYEDAILGDDRDAAREEQARFVAAANQSLELRPDGMVRRIADVGLRAWLLPISIVFEGGAWRFDTEAPMPAARD